MNAYIASDYAGLEAGVYEFYFGYERTICPVHGNDSKCECNDKQWAFVARKNGQEVGRLSARQVHYHGGECVEALLRGIARFGDKFWKE